MTAHDVMNPVQFHATVDPAAFPATDWVHLGTHKAASDRADHVRDHYGHSTKIGMVASKLTGGGYGRAFGIYTDHQANEISGSHGQGHPGVYDSEGRIQPAHKPGVYAYMNEHEDPGSTSYVAHKSRVKVIYRGPVK